jgi:SAM-dependent methyltransferase
MDDRIETNRANWEERAALHPQTAFYDVPGFLDGDSTLRDVERRELGDAVGDGTRLCHLMCHIGLDTLSWAREGASVVGVDFSETAVHAARDIAADAGLADRARFVQADVTDPDAVGEAVADADHDGSGDAGFDVVFASYGVLVWLPDLSGLTEAATELLAPGGTFYLVDGHPLSHTVDDAGAFSYSYFREEPFVVDAQGSYADPDAEFEHTKTYQWTHTLGDVVSAVADAGLRVEFCHEFPFTHFEKFDGMVEAEGWWRRADGPDLPLLFSLKASNGDAEAETR